MSNNYINLPVESGGPGAGVSSLNGLTGALALVPGANITITPSGLTLIIDTTGIIASINADSTAAQTLTTGTTGTDFAIVDNGTGDHKFNLPTASAVNRGALSSADWSTFNAKQPAGSYITALTTDVVASGPGSVVATIQPNVVSNSKLAQMPASTIKGNNTGGLSDPLDLTIIQVDALLKYVLAVGLIDSQAPSANGLIIDTANNIYAQSASATAPGMINTAAQTFAGAKTFSSTIVGSISGTAANVTGIVAVPNGGTGLSTAPTNGQLLIGNGTTYTLAALTAGSGISVTNGAGSITVATTNLNANTTKTANYPMTTSDSIIFCDTSGGAFTLTLPAPAAIAGKIFRIIDTTGFFQTNNLTLARNASEKIEGLNASKVLQTPWGWFEVTTNGTDWFVS